MSTPDNSSISSDNIKDTVTTLHPELYHVHKSGSGAHQSPGVHANNEKLTQR